MVARALLRKNKENVSSLNLIFKLNKNMSPADFWYVLVKRPFFQNIKNKNLWLHLNTLKPGPKSIKINILRQPNWLNICHYGFWKYYIIAFSEAFSGCSFVHPILSHFHQTIKNHGHCYISITIKGLALKFWLRASPIDP